MAGKRINDPSLLVASVTGGMKIPVATPQGNEPKACTVDKLFLSLRNILGIGGIQTFSTQASYGVSDLVKRNNKLYRFIEAKTPGDWDSSKVVRTSILKELLAMRTGDDETVNVTVVSGDNGFSVEGLTVTMAANGTTTNEVTNANGTATFRVNKGVGYTLSMTDRQGYHHVPAKSIVATFDEREEEFRFIPNNNQNQ